MGKQSWMIYLPDGKHEVELEHGYWSGKRTIRVDGSAILQERSFMDRGSEHPFTVSGHPCRARITTNGMTFRYDLVLDGNSVTTGEAIPEGAPTFPFFGGPRPTWAGGRLTKLEDELLALALCTGLFGAILLISNAISFRLIGGVAVGLSVVASFQRRRPMFLVLGVLATLMGVAMCFRGSHWRLGLLYFAIAFFGFNGYRKHAQAE